MMPQDSHSAKKAAANAHRTTHIYICQEAGGMNDIRKRLSEIAKISPLARKVGEK